LYESHIIPGLWMVYKECKVNKSFIFIKINKMNNIEQVKKKKKLINYSLKIWQSSALLALVKVFYIYMLAKTRGLFSLLYILKMIFWIPLHIELDTKKITWQVIWTLP